MVETPKVAADVTDASVVVAAKILLCKMLMMPLYYVCKERTSGVVGSLLLATNTQATGHKIVLEGCYSIGRLDTFVDATISSERRIFS